MKRSHPFAMEYRDVDYRVDAAREVVPFVMDLLRPASVADIGCNSGHWLSVFREHGVGDTMGYDGPWVDTGKLLIPKECFAAADLNRPLPVTRRFDLVVCLEVVEHLEPENGGRLVAELAAMGRAVLFSAALPGQGGYRHINEQWPDYWVDAFRASGMEVIDCIRPRLWGNARVYYYYAQNAFLFVSGALLDSNPSLQALKSRYGVIPLALVHPGLFSRKLEKARDRSFPGCLLKSCRRWAGVLTGRKAGGLKERFTLPPSARTRI